MEDGTAMVRGVTGARRRGFRRSLACGMVLGLALLNAPLGVAGLSDAQAREFFNRQGCNACHGADETRLAPSFALVARRYPNATPEVVERLSLKIRLGGAGAWGAVPMISYPGLSDEDARRVARWILGLPDPEPRPH